MADLLSTIKGFFRKKKDEEQPQPVTPSIPTTNLGVGTNTPSLQGVPKDNIIQPAFNKIKDSVGTLLGNIKEGAKMVSTPEGQEALTQDLDPVRSFIINRLTAPIAQVPYNIKEAVGGEDKSALQRGLHGLSAVGGMLPGVDDLIYAGYDYLKGVKAEQLKGEGTVNSYKKGIDYLVGKKRAGLGDAVSTDPTTQGVLNIAELPLTFLVAGKVNRVKTSRDAVLNSEKSIRELSNGVNLFKKGTRELSEYDYDYADKLVNKLLPNLNKSSVLRGMKDNSPSEWVKTVTSYLEDALVQAKNPELPMGLSVRSIKRLEDTSDAAPKSSLKTVDDVVSAIQKDFKINPSKWDSNEPPIRLNEKEVVDSLKNNYDVSESVLKDAFKNKKVNQGTGYVMQNNNGQIVFNVFDDFKNKLVEPVKEKAGVSLGVVGKPKAGVEMTRPKVKVNYIDPTEYAKNNEAIRGGTRKIEKMPVVETDPAKVESVKASIIAGDKINPIVLDKEGNIIEGAEHLQALKELGINNVQVVVKKNALTENGVTQSKSGFNEIDREAKRLMEEEYGLKTPKEFDANTERQFKETYKAGERLDKTADAAMKSETIDLAGKGDIQAPPEVLQAINRMKDKSGVLAMPSYNRETPLRNIEDIAATPEDAKVLKDFFFGRVTEDTRQINNFVSSTRNAIKKNIIDDLGIKPDSDLDKLTMQYGEGKMTLDELKQATPEWSKVVQADAYFRNLYDNLLTQINDVVTKYGYDPVPKRQNYYTHFQEMGNVFTALGNINKFEQLPTVLAGLTADFKPGKQFFKFAQPRLSDNFKYSPSAIKAVDTYLEPAANQMFRTETIQRGRTLERIINEDIQKNQDLPNNYLNNFMSWYRDYLNTLAGKKSLGTRGMEQDLGRWMYTAAQTAKKQASANLVGGSVTSAFTNFIPLTQSIASTEKKSFLQGLIKSTLSPLTEENNFTIDGVQSAFLRNRFGPDKLAPNWYENVAEKMSIPFQLIDKYISNAVVSGKYIEQLKTGKTAEQAMSIADDYAARVMADRSFGQLPQVFNDKGWKSFALQFQVEINNQVSYLTKDIPNMAQGDKLKLTKMLTEVAVASWVFNNVYEVAFGRRPAFDPIEAVSFTLKESYSNDNPNQKFQKIAKKWGDNLPFLQLLTGGGRIPVFSGVPDMNELANDPAKALIKPLLVYGPPAGGYQIYKAINGLQDFSKGYAETRDGRMKYLIEQDAPNFVRAILSGQYSFPEAQEYFDEARTPMGIDDTILMKVMLEKNPDKAQQIEEMINKQREINGELSSISEARSQLKLIYGDPRSTPEQKAKAKKQYEEHTQRVIESVKQKLKKGSKNKEESSLIDEFFHLFVKEAYAADETMGPTTTTPTGTQTTTPNAPQTNGSIAGGNQSSNDPLSMIGGLNISGVTKKKIISIPTLRSVAKPKAISLSASTIKIPKAKERKVKEIDLGSLKSIKEGKRPRQGIRF